MKTFFRNKPYTSIMLKSLLLASALAPGITYAALSPQYQNTKDFDVIVNFIKQHKQVLSTLESIDFKDYSVHYGNGCVATFERKDIPKPQGRVGPADPLEFRKSTCPIDH
jgi:hypothetical protein